ncbi:uncharacterized protein RAG0_16407 [Rhynchosporium agropyri]|uniref:Uncharacterized protein n=1 Tax=Rhynchosporium agropyri TaxID=914238 RepID=A0A1E1LQ90_9HELO|nr:uncharacterized protein RAG0_16407 [Rhynchosporium agropyri]
MSIIVSCTKSTRRQMNVDKRESIIEENEDNVSIYPYMLLFARGDSDKYPYLSAPGSCPAFEQIIWRQSESGSSSL